MDEGIKSPIRAEIEKSSDIGDMKPKASTDQDQFNHNAKENPTKATMSVKDGSRRALSEKASHSTINEYVVPLKDEDESAKDKKVITVR